MFSVHLINSNGQGSYLSVKSKSEWKTKRTAVKHANDIKACKHMPWNTMTVEVENEFGEVLK
jgi:hypothetical protein